MYRLNVRKTLVKDTGPRFSISAHPVGLEGEVCKENGRVEVEGRPLGWLARNPQLLHRDLHGTCGTAKKRCKAGEGGERETESERARDRESER